MIARYAAALVRHGCTAATSDQRMSSIKHFHRWAGFSESPTDTVEVETLMRGIRRTLGTAQTGKAPARTLMIRQLVETCRADTLLGMRDRALLLSGFAGAFRRSALVARDVAAVVFQHDGVVVTIRRDTTDQAGHGWAIGIPYGSTPVTCPVRTLRQWRDAAQITNGPIFRAFSTRRVLQAQRLHADEVSRIVKRRCRAADIDPAAYAGHSLREGFVTAAALAGVQEWVIAEQTGHGSMRMLRTYIRKGTLFHDNPAAKVGL